MSQRHDCLLVMVLLAGACGTAPSSTGPLPMLLADARALRPGELAALDLPGELARALPLGAATPVAAVHLRWTDAEGVHEELRGLQFAIRPEAADLTVRGLQRLLGRSQHTAVVFHAPTETDKRRVCILSRSPDVADALHEAGHTLVDPEDFAAVLASARESTGARLLSVSTDEVVLDVPGRPADHGETFAVALAGLMPDPDESYPQIVEQLQTRQVRLEGAR